MTEQIKANLTNCYLMFIFEFADPANVDKAQVQSAIDCPVIDIFKSQRQADLSKKILGKVGFGKAVMLYFDQFQSHDGIDFDSLEKELTQHRKVFLRHLGKDKVNYLNLLIKINGSIEPKRRGLLAV
jgi:hypothetical protein